MAQAGTRSGESHQATDPAVALIDRLKALADPSRLRILEFLKQPPTECCSRDDGVCGCDFESYLGLSQPTVSHHLRILVEAGLLRAQRRGRWTYYELEGRAFEELADEFGVLARAGERG